MMKEVGSIFLEYFWGYVNKFCGRLKRADKNLSNAVYHVIKKSL